MDTLERNQVRLILEQLSSETLRTTEEEQKAMHAEHASKGLLRSGGTIKRAVRIVEEQASSFVEKSVERVSAVAQDVDAFALISSSLTAVFRGYEAQLDHSTLLATTSGGDQMSSAKSAGQSLISEMQARIFKQLEIHRFTFTKPTKGDLAARVGTAVASLSETSSSSQQNRGGKPLAKHWDALWAHIAVQLWSGDLQPETQTDLKNAMFAWFNEAGIEIGDTAVTQRARQLWQSMKDADG